MASVWYQHTAKIDAPKSENVFLVNYTVPGIGKNNVTQAMIHFHPAHGWRSKITPCFVDDPAKDSKFAVDNMIGFRPLFDSYESLNT